MIQLSVRSIAATFWTDLWFPCTIGQLDKKGVPDKIRDKTYFISVIKFFYKSNPY